MSRIISRKRKSDNKEEKRDKEIRRLLWLLLLVVLVLGAMLILPILQKREKKAEGYACTLAVRRAQDAVIVEFLSDPDLSESKAAVAVDKSKLGRDELCPSNGDYYLVPQGGSWRVACGLHEEDTKLRTRLNATRVYNEVQKQVYQRSQLGMEQGLVVLTVNGQPLEVRLLEGDNGLRRGTDYSIDFDGVVSFYSLNASGEINWFVYADANHAAVWKSASGWGGDAY